MLKNRPIIFTKDLELKIAELPRWKPSSGLRSRNDEEARIINEFVRNKSTLLWRGQKEQNENE